jgi:hypothetical protein
MSKTADQIRQELNAKIPRDVIAQREGGGRSKLSYLEGWYVIDRLNEVLGQGNWEYETEEMRLVYQGQVEGKYGTSHVAHYVAKIRLTVHGLRTAAVEDKYSFGNSFSDYGYGDGSDKANPGKAHELAVKEAVTDGLKRCAKNLGMSMGLALYDKNQENVDDGDTETPAPAKAARALTAAPQAASVPAAVPARTLAEEVPRDAINELIGETSKVILDKAGGKEEKEKKLRELRDLMKNKYGTTKKEELSDDQARELYSTLKGMVA